MSELPQVVMVIEDNATMRNFLQACVAGNGYDAAVFDDHDQAIARYRTQPPAAVILGLSCRNPELPFTTIAALKRMNATVPIVVLPGQARDTLVRAMQAGAADFISAPFDETDIEFVLARALGRSAGPIGPARAREHGAGTAARPTLVGSTRFMERVRDFIDRAAMTDEPVLISGDSGTGKTLVARAIIAASARRDKPFVKVNCASRQNDLLEAEIFGLNEELGNAGLAALGKFASANQGTLVLDGIGEMNEPLQIRLLKLLQDNEYSPHGRTRGAKPDVRIIATSSTDPERAVSDGYLREDLFFRLNVLSLQLLPLRLRRDDIPVLAQHLLTRCSQEFHLQPPELSPQAMQILMEHEWPGNVRELDNVMRRVVLLGAELSLEEEIAPSANAAIATDPAVAPSAGGLLALAGGGSLKEAARTAAREVERALILRALEQTRWNRRKAADMLGVSYRALLKKLRDINVPRT